MTRVSRAAQLFVVLLGLVPWSRPAAAQGSRPQSIHVLEIDSDDADDQAEALTGALRSRARSAPGWVLLDTTQSLSMLTAALRCPQHPDAACLFRIADQLKADRFIWGLLTRQGAGPHQVSVELHLWARGKADVVVKETYSDNLKDQGDDTLRKIANRSFDRLTGGAPSTVTLHAGTADGMVIVDGDQKVALQHGSATLTLAAGAHTIEIQAAGFTSAHQSVTAIGGVGQEVNVDLQPEAAPPPPVTPEAPRSGRRTAMWGTLIGGGALLVAGGVLAIVFEVERHTDNSDASSNNYGYGNTQAPVTNVCTTAAQVPNAEATQACNAQNTARTILVPEIISLGAGGILATVGIVLAATEPKKEAPPDAQVTGLRSFRFVPQVGPRGVSMGLAGSF